MIYIRVDSEWYATGYTDSLQLTMYESTHAHVVYNGDTNTILSQMILDGDEWLDEMPEAQIRLELFLQGQKFKVWNQDKHRLGNAKI